jgi:hypothetical protein
VRSVFERLIGEKEYKETRKLHDDKGLYLWDVTISEEDGSTEYSYIGKGRYAVGGSSPDTAIHVTYYDNAGMPVHGSSVAKYKEGEWKLTP